MYSVDIADVDNDGQTEIIAGGGRVHTGAPGVYVYAINGSTGAVEWKSINLGDTWSAINFVQVGNVDNDAAPEMVALKDSLYVIDSISHQQKQTDILWRNTQTGENAVWLMNGTNFASSVYLTSVPDLNWQMVG
jgi:hypothetical protein